MSRGGSPDAAKNADRVGFLRSLRIGVRVYGGFAIVLALLAAVSGVGTYELTTDEQEFGTYAAAASSSEHVAQIEADFVGIRRQTLLYATSGDTRAVAEAHRLFADLRKEVAYVRDHLVLTERREQMQAIGQAVDAYAANFEAMLKSRATRDKIVDERMNVLGPEARGKLSDIIQTAIKDGDFEAAAHAGLAQENLLLMRLNAVRFLDRPEQAIIDRVKKEAQDFQHEMNGLLKHLQNPRRRQLAVEALELGNRYAQAFHDMAAVALELDRMVMQTMRLQAEAVSKEIHDFLTGQRATLDRMRTESAASVHAAVLLMMTLSVAALVLGMLAAWLIARGITRPVTELTAAVLRMADGDLDNAALPRPSQDEVGQMAAAGRVLLDKLRAARAAEAALIEDRARRDRRQSAMDRATQDFGASISGALAARLRCADNAAEITATIEDASRGGVGLACRSAGLTPGMEVEVRVANLTIPGRVARLEGAITGIAFRQNPATLALADQLLEIVRAERLNRRAA